MFTIKQPNANLFTKNVSHNLCFLRIFMAFFVPLLLSITPLYFSYLTSLLSCNFLSISDTDAAEVPISSAIELVETLPSVFKLVARMAFK